MDDLALRALLIGFLRVSAGAVVGILLYRYSLPPVSSAGPVASGRRFFAWMSLICTLSLFGKAVVPLNGEAFARWLISFLFFGLVAFLVGLAWGKFRRYTAEPKVTRRLDSAVLSSNVEAKSILQLRLAKGEITIAEFNNLLTVIDGTSIQSSPPMLAQEGWASNNLNREQRLKMRRERAERILDKANISNALLFTIFALMAVMPLFLRPPGGSFPGVGVVPMQFLCSWAILLLIFPVVSAIVGFPLFCCLWIYARRMPSQYKQFLLLGGAVYLSIEILLTASLQMPPFSFLCGSGPDFHAFFAWW